MRVLYQKLNKCKALLVKSLWDSARRKRSVGVKIKITIKDLAPTWLIWFLNVDLE